MFTSRFARRIAGAVLAAMLTVGGVVAVDEAQQDTDTTEEALRFRSTNGATWS